jgi:hypothetical protein
MAMIFLHAGEKEMLAAPLLVLTPASRSHRPLHSTQLGNTAAARLPSRVEGMFSFTTPIRGEVNTRLWHQLRLRGGLSEAMDVEELERPEKPADTMDDDASDGSTTDDDVGQCVVPVQGTLIEALYPALGEDDDYDFPRMPTNLSSFTITVTEGKHNLTEHGELPLCKRVHIVASKGVRLAAYAHPRPQLPDCMFPTHGGGRLRFMAGATGSTLTGIHMTSINIQCLIIASSAVLFDSCQLRTCHGDNDVSVMWIDDGGHATITASTLGGVTIEDEASQAVVVDSNADAVIVDSILEYCYGSTVTVCENGTARLRSVEMRDSFSAFSVFDDTTSDKPVNARIEAYNCSVQCIAGMWRDHCEAEHFVEINTTTSTYAFKELAAHDIDNREKRVIIPKMRWDPDRNTWKHAGMTKQRRQYLNEYYENHRINGTVDPRKVYI